MQKARAATRLLGFFAFCILHFAFASAASAEIVVFKNGRTMSVQSYAVNGDMATLVLRGGGEVTFPASVVEKVMPDEVPYPGIGDQGSGIGDQGSGSGDQGSGSEADVVAPAPGVPDEVLAARPFADLIATVAAAHNVDARLVHAVVEQESNYQARARSPKGARGLMQLMPATARQYGVRNSYDPQSNLEAGVRHLKDLLSRLDLPLALAAYNAGEATVRRYGGLPPFPETQSYVRGILGRLGR